MILRKIHGLAYLQVAYGTILLGIESVPSMEEEGKMISTDLGVCICVYDAKVWP